MKRTAHDLHRVFTAIATTAATLASGCAAPLPMPAGAADAPMAAEHAHMAQPGTPDAVNIALARAKEPSAEVTWNALEPGVFERAAQQGRLVLLDGEATWCHWCHVMEATTYRDPEVVALLEEHFIAVKVDIDARPDIGDRYADYGWPATVLFDSDGRELGAYRGYMRPAELLAVLRRALAEPPAQSPIAARGHAQRDADLIPATSELSFALAWAAHQMDDYYDVDQGGWGFRQKAPLGANATFELWRARAGDAAAAERAHHSLTMQRALIDPVWGGIYQYSAASHWDEPHFERLLTYQTENLEAYALAYRLQGDSAMRDSAHDIARYLQSFLSAPDGGFHASQDADLGGHDTNARFVDGHVYYALDDVERRALGIPRVDPHVYPYETGLAMGALAAWFEATGDPDLLVRIHEAGDAMLAFVDERGAVRRSDDQKVLYLADAAGLLWGLSRLAEIDPEARVGSEPSSPLAAVLASRVAESLDRFATSDGSYYETTPDPRAAGVFADRRVPFTANAYAIRGLGALSRATDEPRWKRAATEALRALSTPRQVQAQGRMIGLYLVAAAELGLLPAAEPSPEPVPASIGDEPE